MRLLFDLSWFFRRHRVKYGVALLALTCVSVLNMLPPWITGKVIDLVAQGTLTRPQLGQYLLIILGCGLAIYLLRFIWRVGLYYASYRLGAEMRQSIYQRLIDQDSSFYRRFRTGDLMARSTNDVTAVEMAAGEAVLALFDGLLTGLVVLSILIVIIDWRLALLALFPWPLMAFYFRRINRELHGAFVDAQECFSTLNDRVQERVSSIRLIRAYGLEPLAAGEFDTAAKQAATANLTVARAEAKYEPVIIFTVASSFLLAVAGGAWLIQRGELSIGELTAFTLYLGYLIWPMFAYGWLLNLLERGDAAYHRIQAILTAKQQIKDEGTLSHDGPGDLQWRCDGFVYLGQPRPLLRGFEGELQANQSMGVVGPTGVGKSTFLDLITRQLEADSMVVTLDGKPLSQYSQSSLRRFFAIVPQEPFLFSTSIFDNVALGKPEASHQEVVRACRLAQVHDDIQLLPSGYQTLVGEKGVTLSGGQKQRLAIARAVLSDAAVLVLDDALSAVDVATEKAILNGLQKIQGQRSLVVVSHRLSVMETLDQIYVLDENGLLQQGNHHNLVSHPGWYQTLYQYQQLERLVEEGR